MERLCFIVVLGFAVPVFAAVPGTAPDEKTSTRDAASARLCVVASEVVDDTVAGSGDAASPSGFESTRSRRGAGVRCSVCRRESCCGGGAGAEGSSLEAKSSFLAATTTSPPSLSSFCSAASALSAALFAASTSHDMSRTGRRAASAAARPADAPRCAGRVRVFGSDAHIPGEKTGISRLAKAVVEIGRARPPAPRHDDTRGRRAASARTARVHTARRRFDADGEAAMA